MKKLIGLLVILFTMQACYYPVKKDYGIYSKSLVFPKNQKWLINSISTDVDFHHKDMMNREALQLFNEMSNGGASTLSTIRQGNMALERIPSQPETEDLENLKNNTDFNFLVNISTIKVRNDLDNSIGQQFEYKKNESFAIMEVYDLISMKKIYSLTASSSVSVDRGEKATVFTPTSEMMTMKNFRSLLKSVKKNAVKI